MSNQLGNVASAARFGMNPTPMGAAGLVGGALLGGKGGGGNLFRPEFQNMNGQVMFKPTPKDNWQKAYPNMFGTTSPGGMINPSPQAAAYMPNTSAELMAKSPYLDQRPMEQKIMDRYQSQENRFFGKRVPTIAELGNASLMAQRYNRGYSNFIKGL